jgi:hypothetical protein
MSCWVQAALPFVLLGWKVNNSTGRARSLTSNKSKYQDEESDLVYCGVRYCRADTS